MRVFALSDIHIDYSVNARWVADLSTADYRDDVLILAGDVTDIMQLLGWCLTTLAARFRTVLFVPGNHELWVVRDGVGKTSFEKFEQVTALAASCGASMRPFHGGGVSICPLLSWYDYSFGEPSEQLKSAWSDFYACRWPEGVDAAQVAAHFASLNEQPMAEYRQYLSTQRNRTLITFSHFMPRIDLLPASVPAHRRMLDPVLGAVRLETQLRELSPHIHVYGHSHINRSIAIDGVSYINNAFGYPDETRIAAKQLRCIHEG
jgi:predicted phosphodiesterase